MTVSYIGAPDGFSNEGTGAILDSQKHVGGYPELTEMIYTLNVSDGKSNEWFTQWVQTAKNLAASPL